MANSSTSNQAEVVASVGDHEFRLNRGELEAHETRQRAELLREGYVAGWDAAAEVVDQDHSDVAEDMGRVKVARSQPRDSETGEICFDISYEDGSWSRVPIRALMDLEDHSFLHEDVVNAVNDWIDVAQRFPSARRNCICCDKRTVKGTVLCQSCTPIYGPTVMAV
jgi:hypothetical protein